MKIAEVLEWGEKVLSQRKIPHAKMEAAWLLSGQLSSPNVFSDVFQMASAQQIVRPADLLLMRNDPVPPSQIERYKKQIRKRSDGMPLAYLLKNQDFMGLQFVVDKNVLIPRQETEILVEEVLKTFRNHDAPEILDVGTGSGNIAVSLAKNIVNAKIYAVDISRDALRIAKRNAQFHQLAEKIVFFEGNLFPSTDLKVDAIISNPPYIRTNELNSLQKEIQFEPRIALDGGDDGLRIVEPLIENSMRFLKRGGFLFLEVGCDQSECVKEMMEKSGWISIRIIKDYAGIERVIIGEKNG